MMASRPPVLRLGIKGFALVMALLGCLLLALPASAQSGRIVVGVNMATAQKLDPEQQNVLLNEMKAAGVHVVRVAMDPSERSLDFARRAHALGIQILMLASLQYPPNAPMRPWRRDQFPNMWAGHPLSSADPELFRAAFEPFLAKLEAAGITLAAIELGNEINWSAFNADFPLPGSGKGVLTLDDLRNDPEGQQIARGYLQYLRVLATLRDIRDRSRLNRNTPILLAGMVLAEPGDIRPGSRVDAVSFSATVDFMRAHGLDHLVDGYGVHIYPDSNPRTPPARRISQADQQALLSECRPAGSSAGKPCWITEWGVKNPDTSCPSREEGRAQVVRQMRDIFANYAQQGRLGGLMYFAWNSAAGARQADPLSIERCGSLTESGRLAIAP